MTTQKIMIFDIETDGLYRKVTRAWCAVTKEYEKKEDKWVVVGTRKYRPEDIIKLNKDLEAALQQKVFLIGHNAIAYDIPVLEKLYPTFVFNRSWRPQVIDTMILAKTLIPNVFALSMKLHKEKGIVFTERGMSSHSLENWGRRLGVLKGTYGKKEDAWDVFTEEMLEYNEQDVNVTAELFFFLEKFMNEQNLKTIQLEHEIQWLMAKQMRNGYPFDLEKAYIVERELRKRFSKVELILLEKLPPIPDKDFIPKRDNKKLGYQKGVPVKRWKPLKVGSRDQIKYYMKNLFDYTPDNPDLYKKDTGNLILDENTFDWMSKDEKCPDEFKQLIPDYKTYFLLSKRLGMLADGTKAWLKLYEYDENQQAMMYGGIDSLGTATGRASHNNPNLGQVVSAKSEYGKEFRELFYVPFTGWCQVGVDVCGLQLRCLAHYLGAYDNGNYAKMLIETGDIHSYHQELAGLPTRDNAKTFIYGYLFGAGDAKTGAIIHKDRQAGKAIKARFKKNFQGLDQLMRGLETTLVAERGVRGAVKKWKRRYLKGLSGFKVYLRSYHAALNFLLQSAEAAITKKWLVLWEQKLIDKGLKHGWDGDFAFIAWVHDEGQVACKTEYAQLVCDTAQEAMRETQTFFNFRCQLDTEGKIGNNWAECH